MAGPRNGRAEGQAPRRRRRACGRSGGRLGRGDHGRLPQDQVYGRALPRLPRMALSLGQGGVMSTPSGEPMLPENEAMHETRERTIAYDALAVAGDAEAMKAALKEFIVRLMFENRETATAIAAKLYFDAMYDAIEEYVRAPINRGRTA